ncbi:MAG: Gfo/Idh/MocA family oxidoreductase, partial [Planctomycetia bacterium]|nr:Gfo/Idh/MocA family oxidoreductase [Planctomycetia bacterium]
MEKSWPPPRACTALRSSMPSLSLHGSCLAGLLVWLACLAQCDYVGGRLPPLAQSRSFAAMCDVDENQLKLALEKLNSKTSDQPKKYSDFRELLDREKPEICIVATPDHWHPLVMIAAVKSGANVYVEKPIGHTIREGRAMVRAARDTGKVVQVGTHRRVSPHNVSGMEFLKSGKAGKIGMVRAFVHNGGNGPEQPRPNEETPKG